MTAAPDIVPPPWITAAWTARAVADHLNVSMIEAEMVLETAVARGQATRISCGDETAYLAARLRVMPAGASR